MSYELHITRKSEWFGEGPVISLSEWVSVIEADEEMRLDGFAEAQLPDGKILRLEREGLAVWTGYSGHNVNQNMAWFRYNDGNVAVKNPDE